MIKKMRMLNIAICFMVYWVSIISFYGTSVFDFIRVRTGNVVFPIILVSFFLLMMVLAGIFLKQNPNSYFYVYCSLLCVPDILAASGLNWFNITGHHPRLFSAILVTMAAVGIVISSRLVYFINQYGLWQRSGGNEKDLIAITRKRSRLTFGASIFALGFSSLVIVGWFAISSSTTLAIHPLVLASLGAALLLGGLGYFLSPAFK